ncbi:putative ribonuclease H-like domain-containing protein, partial [Tanacetum coccineum]
MPYDLPLLGGYTLGSVEGSKKLNELTDLCTKLLDKVTSLENDLKQTKKVYGNAITKLVKKVKHLEDKLKSTTERRKARMVLSDDEEDLHVTPTKAKAPQVEEQSQESFEAQLSVLSAAKILADASKERVKTYNRRRRSTDSSRDSTAGGTAGGLFSTAEEIQGKTQISTDEEIAQKLNKEEMAKDAAREEQKRIDFEKALELQKTIKPVTVAQARKNMMTYLKNMARYKMGNFKGMSYDEIKPIFEKEYNKVQTLFKKDTEVGKTEKKRVAEETLLQESFKKLRIAEASSSEPIQEQPTGEPKELSKGELKKMIEIVPVEKIKAKGLQVKYPIIDWEIHTEGSRKYWKIIRVSNITEAYQSFE